MKFKNIYLFILIINLNYIFVNGLNSNKSWDNDIYTGRQLDCLVTKTQVASPEIIQPAVLVMYSPSCEDMMDDSLHYETLPPFQFMVFAKYDYETSPKHIWYHMDYRDDLIARYELKSCLEYLYFEKGKLLHDEPERYERDSGENVFSWVWRHMEIKVTIINIYQNPVLVEFFGKGPDIPEKVIQPGKQITIKAYTSYIVLIKDKETESFLFGQELESYTKVKIIVSSESKMTGSVAEWYSATKEKQEEKSKARRRRWWIIARTTHLNIFQPLMLEKFTKLGYKHGKIPGQLYKELRTFYSNNKDNRKPEENIADPVINDNEVKCSIVQLPEHLIQKVGQVMKPILEKWCKCDLVLTYMYGIREYYKGNILMNHVDIMDTHIVSAILQIGKELDNQPDWELEIIGFDGVRQNVSLQSGELLLYESATLVHGRPYPFEGKVFANAFLHFKPARGWHWNIDQGYFLNNNEKISKVDTFASPLTYKQKPKLNYFSDRLKKEEHMEL